MENELATRLNGFDKPTVWHEFTGLANEHSAINLGQGFPDWPAAKFVKDAACNAINAEHNQYCRSGGHVRLVKQLAKKYSPLFGRELDAMTEITVSIGATEALQASMLALVNEGDEVVILEPAFDIYLPQVQMAGGVTRFVPLRPTTDKNGNTHWSLDMGELRAAITPRTRVLLLNTPHNPTGKVFSREELSDIAAIVRDFPRLVVLTDEVYEHIVFDGQDHVRFASLPDMFERTLTVSSAGKTFSITGWKIGYLMGPAHLIKGVMSVNQWVFFSAATPLQEAFAEVLERAEEAYEGHENYYAFLSAQYQAKRDRLLGGLRAANMRPITPQGGIFIMADTSQLEFPSEYMEHKSAACPTMTRDWALARWLVMEKGVASIPASTFLCGPNKELGATLGRFAYCKQDDVLDEGVTRLKQIGSSN